MPFDLLITNAKIIDGTGSPWYWGDLAVEDGKIVSIGKLAGSAATHVIDADGRMLTPGFIDMHTHSDLQLLANPLHECKIRQGVTTDVVGHDGLGLAPITPRVAVLLQEQLAGWNGRPSVDWDWTTITRYLDKFDEKTGVNVATHLPHGTLRLIVMGEENRAPTPDEMRQMQALIDSAMREGAIGLSTGLTYAPCMFATDDEMVELCTALKAYNGIYSPHHRNYGTEAIEAYADSIEIGRRAGVAVHLTHCHLGFPVNKDRAPELLSIIDNARAAGVEVTMDTYPYLAGNTYLHSLLPGWTQSGGNTAIFERLRSAELRAQIKHEMEVVGSDGFHGVPLGWDMISISGVGEGVYDASIVGMSLPEAAVRVAKSPFDFFCDLLIESRLSVSCLAFIGNEENVRAILQHPAHMVGSDGILVGDRPHPRGWGSHARFLAHYTRDLGLLTLEEAVRRMTAAPARRIGCLDRGILRPGFAADLVVFDPDIVRDTATYENPRSYPEGIYDVAVNGTLVVKDSQVTGATPGRALRKFYGRKAERITDLEAQFAR